MNGSRPRIALYGHDTFGLGHVRRNLALAGAFAGLDPRPDTLVLSGAAESLAYPLPPGAEVLVMPSVTKDGDGAYGSRRLSFGLEEVVSIRRGVLSAALDEFEPDLFVVDKVPLGLAGELEPAIAALAANGRTRIVLGLRDVLDTPAVAREEWRVGRMTEAVRSYFHEIWVYGDPEVHDLADACGIPPGLRDLVRHTGLLAHTDRRSDRSTDGRDERPPARPPEVPADRPYVLGMVGGGEDGGRLAAAFAAAPMPAGTTGLLLTGPHMRPADRAAVLAAAAGRDDLVVSTFSPDASSWIGAATAVVSMGGYNTVTEVLGTSVPALVVPRCEPREEQLVRAEALGRLGLVDWLTPDAATAERIGAWVQTAAGRGPVDRSGVDLGGLAAVARLAAAQLEAARASTAPAVPVAPVGAEDGDDEGGDEGGDEVHRAAA